MLAIEQDVYGKALKQLRETTNLDCAEIDADYIPEIMVIVKAAIKETSVRVEELATERMTDFYAREHDKAQHRRDAAASRFARRSTAG